MTAPGMLDFSAIYPTVKKNCTVLTFRYPNHSLHLNTPRKTEQENKSTLALDLQEEWMLGKLLRPSDTRSGSPVQCISEFITPSGKQR